jgi:alkylated DNA repair dioxygenase AlkB
MEQPQNIIPHDGEAYLFPAFFTPEESDRYFASLKQEIAWKQEPIKIFGNTVMQPRLTAWYGDPDKPYSYSGITMHPHASPPLDARLAENKTTDRNGITQNF